MKVEYTDHALERLKERGITKKEVGEALKQGRKMKGWDGNIKMYP
jgi:hypothetical protein